MTSAARSVGLLTILIGAAVAALAFRPAPRLDINDLEWMAGCWRLDSGSRVTEEQWMAPRGGMMLGMARTVRQGRIAEFEMTRIEQRGDSVIFLAQPSGQPAAAFPARIVSRREVIFENTAHDFPQRVIYRNGGDSLHASIEGMQSGSLVSVPFPMARVSCPGNPATAAGVGAE